MRRIINALRASTKHTSQMRGELSKEEKRGLWQSGGNQDVLDALDRQPGARLRSFRPRRERRSHRELPTDTTPFGSLKSRSLTPSRTLRVDVEPFGAIFPTERSDSGRWWGPVKSSSSQVETNPSRAHRLFVGLVACFSESVIAPFWAEVFPRLSAGHVVVARLGRPFSRPSSLILFIFESDWYSVGCDSALRQALDLSWPPCQRR